MSYEEKIETILDNKWEYNGDNEKAIQEIKVWLCCEWQCGAIEDMSEYARLLDMVDAIANRKIRDL